MGPYHITIRLGAAIFGDADELPRAGEPFFDPVAKRLEIATSPSAKIQYPTVNAEGGLGVGFNTPVEIGYSVKGAGRFGSSIGSRSWTAYGPHTYLSTGLYFGANAGIGYARVAANDADIAEFNQDQMRVFKKLRVDDDAEIFGDVVADDFVLRQVTRAFELTGGGVLKDVVVYDTRQDSDGGAWRERCAHTSWYNEVASETRSSRKKFPTIAIIAATEDWVTIYDADEVSLPIWMRFIRGTSRHLTAVVNAVDAYNGSIYVGTQAGLIQFDLVKDFTLATTTSGRYQTSNPISDRNLNNTDPIRLAQFGSQYWLPSNTVKDVSVNYSSQLKSNRSSGAPPEPSIDMVFEVGAVRMNSNRTIFDMTGNVLHDYRSIFTNSVGDTFAYNYTGNLLEVLRAHQSNTQFEVSQIFKYPSASGVTRGFGLPYESGASRSMFAGMANDGVLAIGMLGVQNGSTLPMLVYIDEDRALPSEGMIATVGTNWLTPWCIGNIKAAWLCNSKTLNRIPKAGVLTQVGTVTETYVGDGDIASYSGFSNSNYFTAAHNADHMTIPNGDWSFVWHMNLPATTARQVIFDMASNDYGNNFVRFEIEATTSLAVLKMNIAPYTIEIKSSQPIDFSGDAICILSRRGWWITLQLNDVTIFSVNLRSSQYNVAADANLSLANVSALLYIGRAANAPLDAFQGTLSMFRFSHSAPTYNQVKKIVEWELDLLRKPSINRVLGSSPSLVTDMDGDEFSGQVALSTNYGVYVYSKFVQELHYLEDAELGIASNAVIKSSIRGGRISVLSGTEVFVNLPEYKVREYLQPGDRKDAPLKFVAAVGGSFDEFVAGTATITRTVVAIIDTPVDVPVEVVVTPHPVVDPDPPPPIPPTVPPPTPPASITLFTDGAFNGQSRTYTDQVIALGRHRQRNEFDFNDQVSSIRVVGEWSVYEHAEYRGRSARLTTGDYNQAALQARGLNNNISSFRKETDVVTPVTGVVSPAVPVGQPLTIGGTFSGFISPITGFGTFLPLGITNEMLSVGYSTNQSTGQTEIFVNHPAGIPSTVEVEVATRNSRFQLQ